MALETLNETTDKDHYAQLLNDYREAEAEIDDLTEKNEQMASKMKEVAKLMADLENKIQTNEPMVAEYPSLKERIEKLTKNQAKFDAKYELVEKRSKGYQEDLAKLKKEFQGMVSREKMEEALKEVGREKAEIEGAKAESDKKIEELNKLLDTTRGEMTDLKHELGKIVSENEKLSAGGGKDVNLELDLDLIYGFSIFKKDEFEFGSNISREQLKLWAEHVKKLTSEIHEDFVNEIEELSKRNDLLEEYIEANGLPSPEDSGFNSLNASDSVNLPHPVPSMRIEDIEKFNPSKNQLKEYIDLMFREWRADDDENIALMATNGVSKEDIKLMRELKKLGAPMGSGENKEDSADMSSMVNGKLEIIPDDASEDELRGIINKKLKQIENLRGDLEKAQLDLEHQENTLSEKYKAEIDELESKIRGLEQNNKILKTKSSLGGDVEDVIDEQQYALGALRADQNFVSVDGVDRDEEDLENGHGTGDGDVNSSDDDDHGVEAPFQNIDDGPMGDDDEIPASGMGNNTSDKIEDMQSELDRLTEYSHKLEDDIKQMIFDYDLKLTALQREHTHDIEGFEIQLSAANEKVVDAATLQDNDFATNFNDRLAECWDIRDGETTLKLKHIEEIRELERNRDDLLRECYTLRIRNERLEQNVDERVKKLEEEKEKLLRENEHFGAIASSVSDMKEEMDRLKATREALEQQMQDFEEDKKALHNQMDANEKKWKQEVKKHQSRATTAEADLKNIIVQMHGFDGFDGTVNEELKGMIITRAEAEQMKEEIVTKQKQLAEAIKSKIKLVQTSSYEIDRLRDEIRLFSSDPGAQRNIRKYDLLPNLYNDAFDKRNKLRYRRGLRRLQHGSFGLSGMTVDEYDRRQLRDGLRGGPMNDDDDRSDTVSHFSIFSEVPVGTYQDLLNGNNEQEPTSTLGRAYKYTVGVLGAIGGGITGALGFEVSRKGDNTNQNNGTNNLNNPNAALLAANGMPNGMIAQNGLMAQDTMLNPMMMSNNPAAAAAAHQRLLSANMGSVLSGMGAGMPATHVPRASALSFGGAMTNPSIAGYSNLGLVNRNSIQPVVGTHGHSQSQLSNFAARMAHQSAAGGGVGSDAVNQSMWNIAQQFELAKMGMSMGPGDEMDDGIVDQGYNQQQHLQQQQQLQSQQQQHPQPRRHASSGSRGSRGGMLGIQRPPTHARLRSRETKLSIADIAEHDEREDEDDLNDDLHGNGNNMNDVDISQPIPQRIRKKTHSRTMSTMVSHYGRAWEEVKDDNEDGLNALGDLNDIDLDSDNGGGIGGNKVNIAELNASKRGANMMGMMDDDDDDLNNIGNVMKNRTVEQNRQASQQFFDGAWGNDDDDDDLLHSRSSSGGHGVGGIKDTSGLNFNDIEGSDIDDDNVFKPPGL